MTQAVVQLSGIFGIEDQADQFVSLVCDFYRRTPGSIVYRARNRMNWKLHCQVGGRLSFESETFGKIGSFSLAFMDQGRCAFECRNYRAGYHYSGFTVYVDAQGIPRTGFDFHGVLRWLLGAAVLPPQNYSSATETKASGQVSRSYCREIHRFVIEVAPNRKT